VVALVTPAPPSADEGARADLAVAAGLLGIYGGTLTDGDAGVTMALPLAGCAAPADAGRSR
jgi:hypothetical protein